MRGRMERERDVRKMDRRASERERKIEREKM